MVEKLITKSFERLLEKGKNRGFITYEELGKSLGKRGGSLENTERAFFVVLDEIQAYAFLLTLSRIMLPVPSK